jgi:PKD repeat protein
LEHRLRAQGASESGGTVTAFVAAAILLMLIGSISFLAIWSPASENAARLSNNSNFAVGAKSVTNTLEDSSLTEDSAIGNVEKVSDVIRPGKNNSSSVVSKNATDSSAKANNSNNTVEAAGGANNVTSNPNNGNNGYLGGAKSNELSFSSNIREACAGTSVNFQLETGFTEGKFLWNFGDGNFSSEANPLHTYSKPGSYTVTLSVTSAADGQIKTKSVKNMVLVNPKPEANFEWEFENRPTEAPRVKLINKSESANSAVWSIREKTFSQEINPSLSLKKEGDYPVKLLVVNEFGCVDSVYQYIVVEEDFNLLAPDAFSPNGDGLNDSFMPEALRTRDLTFKLTIYNNNQPIFETSDRFNPWKGVLPNGTFAKAGTSYPWVVQLTNEKGETEYYSGTVTVTP